MLKLVIVLIAFCVTIINAIDYSIHIKGRLECLEESSGGVLLSFYTREDGKLTQTDVTEYASGDFDVTAKRTTNAKKVEFLVDFLHNCAFSGASGGCSLHFNRTISGKNVANKAGTAQVFDLGKIEVHNEWNDEKCDDEPLQD